MQRSEFNGLMDGNPAKWANLENSANPNLLGLLAEAKTKGASQNTIKEAREAIAKEEVQISHVERERMNKFIEQQRAANTKERTIRRMVQRMWNITIV